MIISRLSLILGLLVMLAGCGGSAGTAMDDEAATGDDSAAGSARSSSAGDDDLMSGDKYGDPAASDDILEVRVVYFEFDKADVDQPSQALLAEHGSYLAENPGMDIRLEGHADERGSREYNIGLGESRAQAVRQILLLRGASSDQLTTVSYGEERPAVLGGDEEAWSLNRRVELVYKP
jgi:peptidoglycan-associated lipoprotein